MRELSEHSVDCPYCGESIDVLVDPSVPQQNYVEDCQVCCRPIDFHVAIGLDGGISLLVSSDSE